MARPSGASDDAEVVELEAVALAEGEQCVPFIAAGSGAEVGRGGRGRDDIAGEAAGGGRVGAGGAGVGVAGAVTISDVGCSPTVELEGTADSDIGGSSLLDEDTV